MTAQVPSGQRGGKPAFRPEPVGYLYQQLAGHLAELIESGELRPGQRLPAEQRLAREYKVSLGTSRHATQILQARGLVVTVPAKGVFVARRDTASQRLIGPEGEGEGCNPVGSAMPASIEMRDGGRS